MGAPDTGRRIAQLLRLAPAPPPPGRIPAMLAARRRIIDQPMVPSVMEPGKLVPDALVARADDLEPLLGGAVNHTDALRQRIIQLQASRGAGPVIDGRWGGSFSPTPHDLVGSLGVMTYPAGGPASHIARRHEAMHGYNEAARQGFDGMPMWSRVTAAAPPALAIPLDELVAQRAGGAAFLDIPWGRYAEQYAQMGNPGAARTARALEAAQRARLAGGQIAEFASDHPVLLGAGVGTAYLLNQALAEEEGE